MKTKPILFSTHMVQAILAGRKTQTRRIVKMRDGSLMEPEDLSVHIDGSFDKVMDFTKTYPKWQELKCPYGNVGDILWVRETWKPGAWREDGRVAFDYKASPELTNTPWVQFSKFDDYFKKWTDEIIKNGSKPDVNGFHYWEAGKSPLSWKPSIFMPFEACRLFLKIKSVRVERLQEISEDDAKAEGIQFHFSDLFQEYRYRDYDNKLQKGYGHPVHDYPTLREAKSSFQSLWESINGKASWEQNPFVWVYEFERIEKPIL